MRWLLIILLLATLAHADGPMDTGEKYYLKGLYSSATSSYKKALEYDLNENNRALCWYMIGQSYLMMQDLSKSRAAFNQIRSKYTKTAWLAPAYVGLGDGYYCAKDYNTALKYYKNSTTKSYLSQHGSAVYYRYYKCYSALKSSKSTYYKNLIQNSYPHSLENRLLLSTKSKSSSKISNSSSSHKYTVQISYSPRSDFAQEYATKIKKMGFPAFVKTSSSKGKQGYRVLVGEYNSQEAAKALFKKLKSKKIDAFVTKL